MTIFLLIIASIICPFAGLFFASCGTIADFLHINDCGISYISGYIFGAIHLFLILLVVAKMGVWIK